MEQPKELTKTDCGTPMTKEESRTVQIDMLNSLVDFCDQNGLRYFLSGGTLLGAIRHHGYIPWDDDIDVNIPRPDCEKLVQLTGGTLGKYRLAGPDEGELLNCCNWFRVYDDDTVVENFKGGLTEENPYYHPIFIDIFPIDGLPDGDRRCRIYWGRLYVLHKMRRASSLQHMEATNLTAHIFHIITIIPAKLIGYRRWGKRIEKYATKYDFRNHKFVGVTALPVHLTKERVEKEKYLETVKVIFEGNEYNAPGNYDVYLKQLFGDYMKLPPIEQQKSHHIFYTYWREKR